ncbi:MAG: hypothetical protein COT17_03760 [Elusimicrobia bacterium CG08_land_8_20_14_0_20_51_18]|nr:MAG: hypothetical protein COT17_03760 [Elusimicrobia bacterium CG08_land_8_20_14_0_20_51_18]
MKLKSFLTVLPVFLVVFFLYAVGQRKAADKVYRDAPSDFTDINMEYVDSRDVPVPEAVPSREGDYQGGHIQQVAIYGDNTLNDYYRVDKSLQQLADSVAAIVKKSSLVFDEASRTYKPLNLKVVGEARNLAAGADFADQKILAFCSGSLVAGKMVLTAGHCVSKDPKEYSYYKDILVLFGWKQTGAGQYNASFSEDQVFKVERIAFHKLDGNMVDRDAYQDYALLELDKSAGKEPLAIDRTGEFLVAGNKVFLAGYPMGMSVKITDPNDASIQEIGKNIYTTDLDAFGGNSGGPVFDSYTKRITGVVVTANARQFKYTLNSEAGLNFKVNQATQNDVTLNADDRGLFLDISQNILNGLNAAMTNLGASVDNAAGRITFPAGLVYYDNNPLGGLVQLAAGKANISGEPVKLPAYEGIGTGVQRINSLIEALTPLTRFEVQICESISARMRASRPVIDPNLMMLYKLNRCDKTQSI